MGLTHHNLLFVKVIFFLSKNVLTHYFLRIFFSSQKCVLTHHNLLFVIVFFFSLNRCPHSPNLFSLIVFCFSLQECPHSLLPEDFFSFQKYVITHNNLLFVIIFFFFSKD